MIYKYSINTNKSKVTVNCETVKSRTIGKLRSFPIVLDLTYSQFTVTLLY